MKPVNRKYQNLRPRSLAKWALTCHGGSCHERLLSESSRSYLIAYYLSVFVLVAMVATVLSTFRTDQSRFKFSPNSPWAISTDKILHTCTCSDARDPLRPIAFD